MMMLDLKFGAHCYKLTLQTKPAGNQPSFQFMSSGNPDTLWTEFYSQKSSNRLVKYLENHAPSHLSYDTWVWETCMLCKSATKFI